MEYTTPGTDPRRPGAIPVEQRHLTALFRDPEDARQAYRTLIDRGYRDEDISIVMSDETRKQHFSEGAGADTEMGNKAAEGAGVGGALGGTIGALVAGAAAIGTTLAIPGIGVLVAGPLAAGLAGAGAGGLAGGVVGALVGMGIPEERVKQYEKGIKSGGTLIAVAPRNDVDARELEQEWRRHHAEDIH